MNTAPTVEQNVFSLLEDIEEQNVLEDCREYDVSLLRDMYKLNQQEAEDLYYLIQRKFDATLLMDSPGHIPSWIHKEYYHEASYLDFEGFTRHEAVVIIKWLDDMGRYWKVIRSQKDRDPITGRPLKDTTTYGSKQADT